MKTYTGCIPCFFQQALDAAEASGADDKTKKAIIDKICLKIRKFKLSATPPEMGRIVYKTVKEITRNKDPFKNLKQKSNKMALSIFDDMKNSVVHSEDRFLKASELAIIGNSIDYGAQRSFDVEREIKKILNKEFDSHHAHSSVNPAVFNYRDFKKAALKAKNILYIGDNAGEIVFDRLLVEEIKRLPGGDKKNIVFSVRGASIINDALMEDAVYCGLDKIVKVISSGCDAPGVILGMCSREFLGIYNRADLIVSKGQGNFEALSDDDKRIFYLFRVKCPVVAGHMKAEVGNFILTRK